MEKNDFSHFWGTAEGVPVAGRNQLGSASGKRDSIQSAFWECGSHGLNGEEALAIKCHLLCP